MITFKRVGTHVRAEVSTGLSVGMSTLFFEWETGRDLYAELLAGQLQKRLSDTIRSARTESYYEGYRDAKAKRKKADWFKSWF